MLQPMEDMILPPKRQAVVDRLRRRIETYRRRQSECVPRFDQSFTGACEQQNLETSALQKRFLEGKAKRQAKKSDRKPELPAISGNVHSSVHVQQKFGCGDYEPPSKLQCGGVGGNQNEGLTTKFSVEIVQQLEFTTSAADSQPQQISTNVTVKALANAVKTSNSPPPTTTQPRPPTPLECKEECKSEAADDEYVGLDECAAALERDAASAFPGLADLIGEDDGDEITSAAIEDLITEISEYPEFMKDFDLDAGRMGGGDHDREPYSRLGGGYGGGPGPAEMSPAAQTLKQMAEQHQQAAGEWARYRPGGGAYTAGPGYRPRGPTAPPPGAPGDHLHMSQAQQLHISQPHHNLQVSAGQHMAVRGELGGQVSVAAQQGMYASFNQQGTPPPHHQGGGCDSYTVSQSQTINFSQGMRQRPQGPGQAQPTSNGPLGVAAAGLSREQQAKMLQQQQQQMLRAQQQLRPPPPEYKAHAAGARYATAGVPGPRRAAMPPLGVRGGYLQPPSGHPRGYPPEWRQVLMQQQALRHPFSHHHQGGFNLGGMGGGMTIQQQQMQQLQHQQQARLHQQQMMQQQRAQSQQPSSMSHLAMQQSQMMNAQGQMSNIHMSQSQSVSMQQSPLSSMSSGHGSPMSQNGPMGGQNGPIPSQNGPMQGQNGPMQSSMSQNGSQHSFPSLHNASSFPGQPADFNLDFLDSMPSSDAANMTAQELLNSLDNAFLNDIL